jgi:hypothetical protein
MKIGDIVKVNDGSYSLFYAGDGEISQLTGNDLRGRTFKVLLADTKLPTTPSRYTGAMPRVQNDMMLCEMPETENVLFTQSRFCELLSRPTEVPDKLEVTIPYGTKEVVIRVMDN